MKTLFALSISILLVTTAFSQYSKSASYNNFAPGVTITFNGNKDYQVLIDGAGYYSNNNDYGRHNNNVINVPNLQQGQHSIQVNKMKRNNRQGQTIYSSWFTLKQGSDLNIIVDNNGRVQMTETRNNYNGGNYNRNSNKRDHDRDYDDRNGRYNNDNRNGQYNNNSNDPYNQNNRYRTAMAEYNFNQLVQSINGKWFQNSKVNSERDVFNDNNNYFSTYQIKQLLSLISSESNRLELAKLSYRAVVDANNFYQLNDLFSNQSYRDELNNYVRDYRY